MTQHCDVLIKQVKLASMQANGKPYGLIENASVAIKDGKIVGIFTENQRLPTADHNVDGQDQWLLPGFIDCHTHLVYGGSRASEFEQRLLGVSYTDIAKQGGGIRSTVKATRAASQEQLLQSAIARAKRLAAEGVTCIEIKSGYGLDLDTEIKMLKVAKELEQHLDLSVITTYLGAHALPPEFNGKADDYIDFVCNEVMPQIAQQGLASAVDVFCEGIGFSPEQCEKVFVAAQRHGLKIKAHVEQLSDLKGALLAAEFNALSVDHIEYLAEQDVASLKASGTVAVLLPGAFYYLHETKKPPIVALRQHDIPMAVATDLNPGTSPIASILTAMNMASVLFALTPEEALRGATCHAAKALGLQTHKGQIQVGFDADLCLWDIQHPVELVCGINQHRPLKKWYAGRLSTL
ncbi:imidazolonepropionase [Paraglaciecola hydrolytica]|uniref:Imidazolonepropionase n=1 Tax=Paraglaciecola hydrolytica TaxID=1799789 RepID=A0A136A3K6_9ALTE|nr:imidazolonepropionase [Paraglaciecola hydrolytica]KXI29823.1 imidazolonepropionase [Paraglaciecola hydrolytica]